MMLMKLLCGSYTHKQSPPGGITVKRCRRRKRLSEVTVCVHGWPLDWMFAHLLPAPQPERLSTVSQTRQADRGGRGSLSIFSGCGDHGGLNALSDQLLLFTQLSIFELGCSTLGRWLVIHRLIKRRAFEGNPLALVNTMGEAILDRFWWELITSTFACAVAHEAQKPCESPTNYWLDFFLPLNFQLVWWDTSLWYTGYIKKTEEGKKKRKSILCII